MKPWRKPDFNVAGLFSILTRNESRKYQAFGNGCLMSFIKERIIFPTFCFLPEQLDLLQQIVHTFKVRQAPLLTSCESYVIIGIKELFVKGITCFFYDYFVIWIFPRSSLFFCQNKIWAMSIFANTLAKTKFPSHLKAIFRWFYPLKKSTLWVLSL